MPPSLTTIMNRNGTDKGHYHHYDGEYARHFEPLRELPLNILEIGIGGYSFPNRGGESLKTWRDYFPKAIVNGLDIETKDLDLGERILLHQGSQNDPDYLTELTAGYGPFDIIIDDGSHVQQHILTSFETLFPLLKPGGIYVIEDMATAYSEVYGGEPHPLDAGPIVSNANTIRLLAYLVDGLHWRCWTDRQPTDIQKSVKSVHISEELAFIYKQ